MDRRGYGLDACDYVFERFVVHRSAEGYPCSGSLPSPFVQKAEKSLIPEPHEAEPGPACVLELQAPERSVDPLSFTRKLGQSALLEGCLLGLIAASLSLPRF